MKNIILTETNFQNVKIIVNIVKIKINVLNIMNMNIYQLKEILQFLLKNMIQKNQFQEQVKLI